MDGLQWNILQQWMMNRGPPSLGKLHIIPKKHLAKLDDFSYDHRKWPTSWPAAMAAAQRSMWLEWLSKGPRGWFWSWTHFLWFLNVQPKELGNIIQWYTMIVHNETKHSFRSFWNSWIDALVNTMTWSLNKNHPIKIQGHTKTQC